MGLDVAVHGRGCFMGHDQGFYPAIVALYPSDTTSRNGNVLTCGQDNSQ